MKTTALLFPLFLSAPAFAITIPTVVTCRDKQATQIQVGINDQSPDLRSYVVFPDASGAKAVIYPNLASLHKYNWMVYANREHTFHLAINTTDETGTLTYTDDAQKTVTVPNLSCTLNSDISF